MILFPLNLAGLDDQQTPDGHQGHRRKQFSQYSHFSSSRSFRFEAMKTRTSASTHAHGNVKSAKETFVFAGLIFPPFVFLSIPLPLKTPVKHPSSSSIRRLCKWERFTERCALVDDAFTLFLVSNILCYHDVYIPLFLFWNILKIVRLYHQLAQNEQENNRQHGDMNHSSLRQHQLSSWHLAHTEHTRFKWTRHKH